MKVLAAAIAALGLTSEIYERFWMTMLPILSYQPGLAPILVGAAILSSGAAIGMLVMSLVAGSHKWKADELALTHCLAALRASRVQGSLKRQRNAYFVGM